MPKEKVYTVVHGYDTIGTAPTHAEALELCRRYVLDNNVSARLIHTATLNVPDCRGQKHRLTHVLFAYRTLYFEQFLILPPYTGVADFVPPTM